MPTLSELDRDLLHAGSPVGGCRIVEPIAQDDNGILYVADDPLLQRQVLVREHFPLGLAARGEQGEVVLLAGGDPAARATALEAFLRGARWLTRFEHPAIGRALRVWEERGTAYLMLPLVDGETLAARLQRGAIVNEPWLRGLLAGLCDALAVLHAEGVYHLGLSPDSIWLLPDDRPMLLDLSTAGPGSQRAISDSIDRQYAPIELFAHGSALPVGPWTDIYSLGAVAHQVLLGRPPVSAAVLGPHDAHAPIAEGFPRRGGRMLRALPSAAFLAALDRALAVQPQQRPQDLSALRALLDLTGSAPAPQAPAAVARPAVPRPPEPEPVRASPPPSAVPPRLTEPVPPRLTEPVPAPEVPRQEPVFGPAPTPVHAGAAPDEPVDPAAAAAIAMAVSSLPWAHDSQPRGEAPGRDFASASPRAAREPRLDTPTWTMPAPRRRAGKRGQGVAPRLVAAGFGLLACLGMAGWYVADHPQQVQAWLDGPAPATAPAERPEDAAPAPDLAVSPVPQAAPADAPPVERVLDEAPPAAGPARAPTPAPEPVAAAPQAPPEPAPAPAPPAAEPPAEPPRAKAPALPAPEQAAARSEPAMPSSPRAACGARTNFALFRCMETQCRTLRYGRHAECVQFRADNL